MGSFKPWGSAVSAIEMGSMGHRGKAPGCRWHTLLGGKLRDKVRAYNGGIRFPMSAAARRFAENMAKMKASPERFQHHKARSPFTAPTLYNVRSDLRRCGAKGPPPPQSRPAAARIEGISSPAVEAMKDVLDDEIGLALDCGPGFMGRDAIRSPRRRPLNVMWLEDMVHRRLQPLSCWPTSIAR